jgi:hypothetical protein
MWPTPLAQEAKHAAPTEWEMTTNHAATQNSLRVQVNKRKVWPTPTAHNAKEGAYPSEYNRNTPTLAAQAGGALNPMWVEWLMGFPLGHTDLNA